MTYGYARVSSTDQNLSRQYDALTKFGIEKDKIFADKRSGKDFERKSYKQLLRKLKKNDLLVINSIDRLGRNYDSIIEEWARITNKLGCDILVLDMPILDTRTKSDTLVGKFISDVVLQVLSFVAENERNNIRIRQAEGIRLAKKQGVKFGRPTKDYSPKFIEVAIGYKQKIVPLKDALNLLNTSKTNFYHHIRKMDKLGLLHN